MRDRVRPVRLPLLLGAVALTAAGCGHVPTETVDIVSFTGAGGTACTVLVAVSPASPDTYTNAGDETDASIDCEAPPRGREPVRQDRRPLPEPERDWEWEELITTTDAHGRACTLVASTLGSGVVDETRIDCDYPPEGVEPGEQTRRQPPDPDPESDDDRASVVAFTDAHGRACTTMTSRGAARAEVDIDCAYTAGEPPGDAEEAAVPR
ncbi:hypothetical protein ACFPZ0_00310 [Streptomonospora nanhaiensis]|uniref:hypothetical protein n=1 Tax=Streptomonospora nanhaiensis TaxID=1323731 RepID=UPI001C992C94|nr:hypothetical protein [Streptomonospora nanhaiensis]MBX9386686.1 hypothetical protein [Streptomonospora nanhaiensis]